MIFPIPRAMNTNVEWDDHIRREYGEVAFRPLNVERDPAEADVDVVDVVRNAFVVWDGIHENAATQAEARRDARPTDMDENSQDDHHEDANIGEHGMGIGRNDEDMNFEQENYEDSNLKWGDPDGVDMETTAHLQRIQEVASVPLYEGSPISSLEAVILMLNHYRGNNATNVLMDQAFALAHRVLLPQPNTLPDSEYAAS